MTRAAARQLTVSLVHGSVVAVPARALVLGVFSNVDPNGAARAVDAATGGLIRTVVVERAFPANAGSVSLLPVSRTSLCTEFVVLAGLGEFNRFSADVLTLSFASVVRTLMKTGIDDWATVLVGAGSGLNVRESLHAVLAGMVKGGLGASLTATLGHLKVCELDDARFRSLSKAAPGVTRRIGTTHGVTVDLRRTAIEAPAAPAAPHAQAVYLLAQQERDDRDQISISCLSAGPRAAIAEEQVTAPIGALIDEVGRHAVAAEARQLSSVARKFSRLVFSKATTALLEQAGRSHLVVVHDSATANVPWELLPLGAWTPALGAGMSRRFLTTSDHAARFAETRRRDDRLNILVVADPTGDLPSARAEADRFVKLAKQLDNLFVEVIRGATATRRRVLDAIGSGRYDVLHFAGHGRFEAEGGRPAGLQCSNGVIAARDLSRMTHLPSVVFLNACETGLVAGTPRFASVAETFLNSGVANCIGTMWPVGDTSAKVFATRFYRTLLDGHSIGAAMVVARQAVKAWGGRRAFDWANYVHYGNPDFQVKRKR